MTMTDAITVCRLCSHTLASTADGPNGEHVCPSPEYIALRDRLIREALDEELSEGEEIHANDFSN